MGLTPVSLYGRAPSVAPTMKAPSPQHISFSLQDTDVRARVRLCVINQTGTETTKDTTNKTATEQKQKRVEGMGAFPTIITDWVNPFYYPFSTELTAWV